MKFPIDKQSLFGTALILATLAAGCRPPEAADPHAGHNHATSESPAEAALAQSGNSCSVHQAPVEVCFLCDPGLRDPGRLWCQEHGRYEDRCWDCHPELRDEDRLYCDEHGLYEDECFYCHPELTKAPGTDNPAGHAQSGMMCTEHGVLEAECGVCRPQAIDQLEPGQSLKVRLPTPQSARGAGVRMGLPSSGEISEGVECYAELAFDQNKLAQIAAPAGGIIQEVLADLGTRLEENQPVARLWSASIAEAVADAVLSHQTLARERKLHAGRVTSEKDLQEAEANHRAACQQVRTLGFSEQQIDSLADLPDERVLLEVRAPFAGEITERLAVRGELVETGRKLFTLADRSTLWAMLNIPEASQSRVQTGQPVELVFDSIPDRTFTGRLTWISPEVDERSRMVRARAEVANPEGLLKARMFAKARILTRSPEGATIVPAAAIQQVAGLPLVFVKLEDGLFDARRVQVGAKANGQVEILKGLHPWEEIAVARSFALKSHLLISRLGAGCAHE